MIILDRTCFAITRLSADGTEENRSVERRYDLLQKDDLKCTYCGSSCNLYGHTRKRVIDIVRSDSIFDVHTVVRAVCTNENCPGDDSRDISHDSRKGRVTHTVFPDSLIPYFCYTAEFVADIAVARRIWLDCMRSSPKTSGRRTVNLMFDGNSQISDLKRKYESRRSGLWNFCFREFISASSPKSRPSIADRFVAYIDEREHV